MCHTFYEVNSILRNCYLLGCDVQKALLSRGSIIRGGKIRLSDVMDCELDGVAAQKTSMESTVVVRGTVEQSMLHCCKLKDVDGTE